MNLLIDFHYFSKNLLEFKKYIIENNITCRHSSNETFHHGRFHMTIDVPHFTIGYLQEYLIIWLYEDKQFTVFYSHIIDPKIGPIRHCEDTYLTGDIDSVVIEEYKKEFGF